MRGLRVNVRVDGRPGIATVGDGLDGRDLDQLSSTEWSNGTAGYDDAKWNWRTIAARYPAGSEFRHVKLVHDGRLEGVMILRRTVPFRSSELTVGASEIVYVTASPWSRKRRDGDPFRCDHPRVTPVGLLLLMAAVKASRDQGHDGRIAWHSEPGAEGWYRSLFPGAAEFPRDWDGERFLTRFEVDGPRATGFVRTFVDSGGEDDFGLYRGHG